jgi:predicted enzyme related to lactoylglutathione lyase
MPVHVKAVTFDCANALTVATFWSQLLDRALDNQPMPPSPFFASIGMGAGSDAGYMFIQVPEGKTVKNRVHLDLDSHDVAAEVARAVSLGATHLYDKAEYGLSWSTLTDPEGNEFCIGVPHH